MTLDPLSMVCPPGAGCPLSNIAGLGLPEILLWVLAFAITYAALSTLKIVNKKASALIAIALGFFVLMAAPAALITVIATMSTGLIVLIVGALVVISLIYAAGPIYAKTEKDKDGNVKVTGEYNLLQTHGMAVGLVVLALVVVLFWFSGGAALIGLGALPAIGTVPIVLVIVGIAILWMLA